MHQPQPCFVTHDLTKIYGSGQGAVHALRGVNLSVAMGEIIVLLGPSGSGKSTLLNILGGLDHATGGTVTFCGDRLDQMDAAALTAYRRQHVGFIFQGYNLMPGLTAFENIALVTDIADNPMPVMDVLEMVGLADRAHHFPAELSGGEQQRVAIARAIAKRPSVLFCDEPTGALDSATSLRVLKALEDVVDALGTTVLMVTHHRGLAPMADRVVYFKDGDIDHIDCNTRQSVTEITL